MIYNVNLLEDIKEVDGSLTEYSNRDSIITNLKRLLPGNSMM